MRIGATHALWHWIRVFRCCNRGHRQELVFSSLPWHVDLVGPCASRISLAGGCLPPLDLSLIFFLVVFFSASGRERGRCCSVHGGKGSWQTLALEWRRQVATRPYLNIKFLIFLTIALGHPCGGLLHVPPEPARSSKDCSSANFGSVARFTDLCCATSRIF